MVRAGSRYQQRHGDHYAAAITFFSVLALVPILMVAFALAGFVLSSDTELFDRLQAGVASMLPAELGEIVSTTIDRAVDQRRVVGVLGLLTALYSGLGWMANLRDAITAQWSQIDEPPSLPRKLLSDLVSLVGLGLALLVSFGLTAAGSGFTHQILDLVGIERTPLASVLLFLGTLGLALLSNWLVFLWVLARLPRRKVPLRSALRGALVAAIGFEILKRAAALYLNVISNSPAGVAFGSVIGLLVFVNLVSRFLLLVTAWTATSSRNGDYRPTPAPDPVVIRPNITVHTGPRTRTVVGLFGAGLTIGLGWATLRRRRPRRGR